ncbi:DUF1707 SHOCT-like domain-containing protein [Diaminobutyricibacter sp. McL0608]|uniref:DUF1707 SHOCT-like domain-containing protein n=1 Tax=Leifsonia sp. McL0608 TaxID=3143537 RepID=UPI0031F2EF26
MSDFTDPSESRIRLSNTERDQAVAALEAHARDGRLTDAELATRSAAARAAVTRGDLGPLFADLPGALPGSNATGTFAPADDASRDRTWDRDEPPRRRRYVWTAIVPFIALILFFLTGLIWGFAFSWLWFLLIPVVGIIEYSSDGGQGRDRNRNRDR